MFDFLKDYVSDKIEDHPKLKEWKQRGEDYLDPNAKMKRENDEDEKEWNNTHYYD